MYQQPQQRQASTTSRGGSATWRPPSHHPSSPPPSQQRQPMNRMPSSTMSSRAGPPTPGSGVYGSPPPQNTQGDFQRTSSQASFASIGASHSSQFHPGGGSPRGQQGGGGDPSMAQRVAEAVFSNELFAYEPTPRFHRRSFGTGLGVFFSIVVLILMLFYIVLTFVRFAEGNVSVAIATSMKQQGDRFLINRIELLFPNIADPRYFVVEAQLRYSAQPGARTVKSPLNISALRVGNETSVDGVVLSMPAGADQYGIWGNCKVAGCYYLRAKVLPCENTTDSGVQCAPIKNITAILDSEYLRQVVEIPQNDGSSGTIRNTQSTSLKSAVSVKKEQHFDVRNVVDRPDLFRRLVEKRYSRLDFGPLIFDLDRLPRVESGPDREFCKLDWQLSGTLVTDTRNPQTLFDLLGSWAAFYGALMGILVIVVYNYNKHRFYKTYPDWDGFMDDFKRGAQETAHEAREAIANAAEGAHARAEAAVTNLREPEPSPSPTAETSHIRSDRRPRSGSSNVGANYGNDGGGGSGDMDIEMRTITNSRTRRPTQATNGSTTPRLRSPNGSVARRASASSGQVDGGDVYMPEDVPVQQSPSVPDELCVRRRSSLVTSPDGTSNHNSSANRRSSVYSPENAGDAAVIGVGVDEVDVSALSDDPEPSRTPPRQPTMFTPPSSPQD